MKKSLENEINEWTEYFMDEYCSGDNNIMKFENTENWDIDLVDEKQISEIVSCIWEKNNYIYIEFNVAELEERYNKRIKQWSLQREEDIKSYWYDKL